MIKIQLNDVGIVVIGRNEGSRLHRSLTSAIRRVAKVVYVDSGSTDKSIEVAVSMGVDVVRLDESIPFSSPRARNAGFERLIRIDPNILYVQFVDGDCEIMDGWIDYARDKIANRSDVAIVFGRRRERFPRASVYNQLCDIEWDLVGRQKGYAGDFMTKTKVFKEVGGFNPSIIDDHTFGVEIRCQLTQ